MKRKSITGNKRYDNNSILGKLFLINIVSTLHKYLYLYQFKIIIERKFESYDGF